MIRSLGRHAMRGMTLGLALSAATAALAQDGPDPAVLVAGSEAFFATMNAGDMPGWLATMAPDVVTFEPVGTPPNVGHEGVMAWMQRNAEMGMTSVHVTLDRVIPAGQETAVLWTADFTLANGAAVTVSGVDIHRFDDDGLIVEVRGYFDPMPMMAAMAANQ